MLKISVKLIKIKENKTNINIANLSQNIFPGDPEAPPAAHFELRLFYLVLRTYYCTQRHTASTKPRYHLLRVRAMCTKVEFTIEFKMCTITLSIKFYHCGIPTERDGGISTLVLSTDSSFSVFLDVLTRPKLNTQ
jgi:hypothetical protein